MRRRLYDLLDGTQPCRLAPDWYFFPRRTDRGAANQAKAICRPCPFRTECLNYALAYQLHGIWGGTTQAERRKIQRRMNITPTPVSVFTTTIRKRGATTR